MKIIFLLIINCLFLNSQSLTIYPQSTLKIIENDSCAITGIRAYEISPDEEMFGLIDKSGLNIQIFCSKTGTQVSYIKSSDSINQPMLDKSEYWFDETLKDYHLLSNNLAPKVGYDQKLIKNTFSRLSFINDTTIMIGGTMRAVAVDTIKKKTVLANIGGLFFLNDSLKIKYSTPIESNNYEYSMIPQLYLYSDSTFLSTVSNYGTNNPDSMTFISEYLLSGKHVRLLERLPDDSIKSKLFYTAAQNPSIIKFKDKVFYSSFLDYKIRELSNDYYIEIKGLDTTNKYSFFNFRPSSPVTISKDEKPKNKRNFYYYINKLINWNNEYIVVNLVNQKSTLQFYTIDGELIKSIILATDVKYKIIDISKGLRTNNIYALAFNDEDYFLLTYKIE
jgi:hypothetical protein